MHLPLYHISIRTFRPEHFNPNISKHFWFTSKQKQSQNAITKSISTKSCLVIMRKLTNKINAFTMIGNFQVLSFRDMLRNTIEYIFLTLFDKYLHFYGPLQEPINLTVCKIKGNPLVVKQSLLKTPPLKVSTEKTIKIVWFLRKQSPPLPVQLFETVGKIKIKSGKFMAAPRQVYCYRAAEA